MDILCIFLPLIGAVITGLFGRFISGYLGEKPVMYLPCVLLVSSAVLSIVIFRDVVFAGHAHIFVLSEWIKAGTFHADWALRFDTLSVLLVMTVTIVSAVVHIYSVEYMAHDKGKIRFMAYLSLFTFAMLMLVTSDNLLQMFFGWEGVGLMSYLLIGFWNQKDSANHAAVKAFIVNRVGDLGFLLGILTVYTLFGTVAFDAIFKNIAQVVPEEFPLFGYQIHGISLACFLLFIGAMGKSAQLGLHTWLPDAMEGPTPVSALIHAATMVTAGVFMVARLSPLFQNAPDVLEFITVIGALTALVGAFMALVQFDIKRIIAYSTMSQLGYMFFALGVSAYGAAIFHLFTHAFFKALLFLGAGSVIHAMSDEQDIRNMGGIWKKIPYTYVYMWVGSLALAGFPWFAGYYSKDAIIESAYLAKSDVGQFAFIIGLVAAFMTAFYSWRLIIMVFHRKPRADEKALGHVHESPISMIMPLFILALGSVIAGLWGHDLFVGEHKEGFWRASLMVPLEKNDAELSELQHSVPFYIQILPVVLGFMGVLIAYAFYRLTQGWPERICRLFSGFYSLLLNKFYFDSFYHAVFENGAKKLGYILSIYGDKEIIDNIGTHGAAHISRFFAKIVSKSQTGFVYHYAMAMLIALVLIVGYLLFNTTG